MSPGWSPAGDFDAAYLVFAGHSLKSRLGDLPLPFAEVAAIGGKIASPTCHPSRY